MAKRTLSLIAAAAVVASGLTTAVAAVSPSTTTASAGPVTAVSAAPAPAASASDDCYTSSGTLSRGDSGEAVAELQIRVAGWMSTGESLAIDGEFGPATENAVKRFQAGYGLSSDGVAGSETFSKIYDLTSSDCTPAHFAYSEFNDNCGANSFAGGAVSAATAQENTRRVMWQLEAMRKKLGDNPLGISSGIRSVDCNASVGGSSSSRHLYGDAADLGNASNSIAHCTLYHAARDAGFTEILAPATPTTTTTCTSPTARGRSTAHRTADRDAQAVGPDSVSHRRRSGSVVRWVSGVPGPRMRPARPRPPWRTRRRRATARRRA
ncbi:D-Ala-D-Ala carboxypeptidase family metallohydrolase [Saccharomonospora sp. CUA-673]|uniref:D-Ala-D-Ala carboxypeptidase family metallohydrolase n=1 Tax=Saccharomonospora sp. CUA-673 TaxID=1904969 RepID=UPI002101C5E0|nr:D-Ala-D-Ala carboxypeptidase family metallohydrolase [Saccharomonospora sp. CUA-673]